MCDICSIESVVHPGPPLNRTPVAVSAAGMNLQEGGGITGRLFPEGCGQSIVCSNDGLMIKRKPFYWNAYESSWIF